MTGGGGLSMTIGDLETARCCGANFMLFAENYAASGYVEASQHAMQAGKYRSSTLIETNSLRRCEPVSRSATRRPALMSWLPATPHRCGARSTLPVKKDNRPV
jgi:hypothetical protein